MTADTPDPPIPHPSDDNGAALIGWLHHRTIGEDRTRLTGIVDQISQAIEGQPDHDKRHKLKAARELVRDVLWGTDVARADVDTGADREA